MKRSAALLSLITLAACTPKPSGEKRDEMAPAPTSSSIAPIAPAMPDALLPAAVHEGAPIARSPRDDALYVADEDHAALRVVPLPLQPATFATVALPGAPASVVALADRVLVTVRDPGMLLVFRPEDGRLVEMGRVPLPADAWGMGVTPDERYAVVTSAWTHKVSLVDLTKMLVNWSVDVAREPRAVVVRKDGTAAYVTYLVGAALTKVGPLDGTPPRVTPLALEAAPLRAPPGLPLDASLAYAAVPNADGRRLFVARHALGALGRTNWFGRPTIDVLITATEQSLAPHPDASPIAAKTEDVAAFGNGTPTAMRDPEDPIFTQPRALAFRRSDDTLLVVGEGAPILYQLDALSIEPAARPLLMLPLGDCAAPSGIALSSDDSTAFVWCRASYSLAVIPLVSGAKGDRLALGEDPLPADAADGRRLFYDATDDSVSGGLGCAGCHPEGRDDGHVWHVVDLGTESASFRAIAQNTDDSGPPAAGFPVQTPMLAGRVGAEGPYGWYAQDKNLFYRIRAGVDLHRWFSPGWKATQVDMRPKLNHLIAFLRTGLVLPPRDVHPPTPDEELGRAVFESKQAGCSGCHISKPKYEFTDRSPYPLRKLPPLPGFLAEPSTMAWKTPSLLFVGGTAPYGHDGRYKTLEDLVDQNDDRMGHTSHLKKSDRAALVAFMRSL